MIRFDAYTATTSGINPHQALKLFGLEPTDRITEGPGYHTFGNRVSVKDHAGDQVLAVLYGGRQADRIMFEVKGDRTPKAVESLREAAEHRVTRVDACNDWDRPGAFDELLAAVMEVKSRHRLFGERRGDWEAFPELGRTQYLGAATSAVRARLYEKGKQPEYRHINRLDWVRLELQVRPTKDAKATFSTLSPAEVWGASRWTRNLAAVVLEQILDAHPPGTVRKDTKRDQALRWMSKQYGPHLVSLAGDLGGWKELGLTLEAMISEAKRR